jgi:dihydrofolate synthase/folylpolyglutamate synthase
VTGRLAPEAAAAIEARASEVGAGRRVRLGSELAHRRARDLLEVRDGDGRVISVSPALVGAHQDDNAAIAIELAWMTRDRLAIGDDAIARGVASVRWPGRVEPVTLDEGPLSGRWVLDGAHNDEGARALAAAIERVAPGPVPKALVFGAMSDKPWREMLDVLRPRFPHRVYVAPRALGGGRRAADVDELARADVDAEIATDVDDALARARARVGREGVVFVAGSLYLVGEARARLLDLETDPQVGL